MQAWPFLSCDNYQKGIRLVESQDSVPKAMYDSEVGYSFATRFANSLLLQICSRGTGAYAGVNTVP
jgi:hypothetical protein